MSPKTLLFAFSVLLLVQPVLADPDWEEEPPLPEAPAKKRDRFSPERVGYPITSEQEMFYRNPYLAEPTQGGMMMPEIERRS